MLIPNAARVLEIWETSQEWMPMETSLAFHAMTGEDGSDLPVGAVEMRLLRLREALFGSRLDAVACCPGCGETLDLEFDIAQLLPEDGEAVNPESELEMDGYRITFRLPTASDAADAERCEGALEARSLLWSRCVLDASNDGIPVAAEDIPDAVCRAIGEQMEAADPASELLLDIACPECGHRWEPALNVARYLQREVDSWALRTLSDIHVLALRYGWAERDILAMSPKRRRIYLQMADA